MSEWVSSCGRARLVLADCLEVLPILQRIDAVVTDPPYGINYNPTRSPSSAASGKRKELKKVDGDAEAFDPSHLLTKSDRFVIWGANYFSSKLPDAGGWLVWDKRDGGSVFRGFAMSDCELAWCNVGRMVRMISHRWCGHLRDSSRERFVHPTQKPVPVMEWSIEQLKIEKDGIVLDPYMGSGTTGVAAIKLGLRFIGIEKDPGYFEVAKDRINRAVQCNPTIDQPQPERKSGFVF